MSSKIYASSVIKLLADLVIMFAIVLFSIAGCEVWRRQRGRLRFSLFDLCVVTTILCVAFGWWQYHVRFRNRERAVISDLANRGLDANKVDATEYQGPQWLRRLAGMNSLVEFCYHVTDISVDTQLLPPGNYVEIRKLTYVHTVHVAGRLNSQLADCLAALPRLRTLDGVICAWGGDGRPDPDSLITSAELPLLEQLRGLRTLRLGRTNIAANDLAQLAKLPHLASFQLSNRDLVIEDIEPLCESTTLKTLDVDISATLDERNQFATQHPGLTVRWPKSSRPDHLDDSWVREGSDPMNVANVLLQRWQKEDGNKEPNARSDRQLDVSALTMTRQRLRRLPSAIFLTFDSIIFGEVDSAETAKDLISQCGPLRELDVRFIRFAKSDFEAMSFGKNSHLCIQQGALTIDDICEMIEKIRPEELNIYKCTYSNDQFQRLWSLPSIYIVQPYRGFGNDEEKPIQPPIDTDPNSPFN